MHAILATKRPAIEAAARRYGVQRLEVVGSAAREKDFDPEHSDVDFLVTFAQPILEGTNRPLPSYRHVAATWSVADKTLDNTLQAVKRKLRNAGLSRDEPLESMVRTVVAHSLITRADLDWARLGGHPPRPAGTGPRFTPPD